MDHLGHFGGALPLWKALSYVAGTQTAGLFAFGRTQSGSPQYFSNAYEYDGSSWTQVTNSGSTARAYLGGFGIQTAAVACGGYFPSSPHDSNDTEQYDGTNWTAGGNLGTARYQFLTTAGPSTALD